MSGWGIAGLSLLAALLLYVGGYCALESYFVRHQAAPTWIHEVYTTLYLRLPVEENALLYRLWEKLDPNGAFWMRKV